MKRTTGHFALYGTTTLPRQFCLECSTYAFVIDNFFKCCGTAVKTETPQTTKRMSNVAIGRKTPCKADQLKILLDQGHCCMYCMRSLGSVVYRKHKAVRLKLNWDHALPYCYSYNNKASNFVAACHICNGIKGSYVFSTFDEARIHIQERWKEKGYSDAPVFTVPSRLQPETGVAKIL